MMSMGNIKDEDCIFRVEMAIHANKMKTLLACMKDIVSQVCFQFTPEGIRVNQQNTASSSMISVFLNGTNFDKYVCESTHEFGVDLSEMHRIMKLIDQNDVLTWIILKNNPNMMYINMCSGKTDRIYPINSIDIDPFILNKQWEYPSTREMPSGEFQTAVKSIEPFCKETEIILANNYIAFSGKPDVPGESAPRFKYGEKNAIPDAFPTKATFKLKTLSTISKCTNLSKDNIMLCMHPVDKTAPFILNYKIPEFGSIKFLIMAQAE